MADDPGGGEPSRLFGSGFGQLADIVDYETKKRPSTGTTPKQKKRGISGDLIQEKQFSKEARIEGNNGPRYLILTRTDNGETMEKLSPFFIKKAVDSISLNVTISRMRDGKLLLKSIDRQQAQKLLKQTMLGGKYGIKVEEHPTLNLTKGVINCRDFMFLKDEEILEELKTEHVISIRRFSDRIKDGKTIRSYTFVLTFNLGNLPSSINVGFYNCKVKQYVPSPLRCFKCLHYGHDKERCRGNQICARCANLYHEGECSTPVVCVNCLQNHHALSKECPIFQDELEIQKLRVTEKISIREATRKRRLQVPHPIPHRLTRSFADVTQHMVTEKARPEGAAAIVVATTTDAAAHSSNKTELTINPNNKAGDADMAENSIGSEREFPIRTTPTKQRNEGKLTPLTSKDNTNLTEVNETNMLQNNSQSSIVRKGQDETLTPPENLFENSMSYPVMDENELSTISQAVNTSIFVDEVYLDEL
ncbi:uncharacterized protein LOC129766938 [Toxorhynchites rutilus septentrionalis]|uniref:uncharacterized protein LOC129766938 n=1 Tax=Toxorhynchites rutilus septentrionalis TaxID=329112 RepID=UPI0024787E94|nr:uncharacterized protein LOC129766938 [Toxorhynchites rutilus septentrionalis]